MHKLKKMKQIKLNELTVSRYDSMPIDELESPQIETWAEPNEANSTYKINQRSEVYRLNDKRYGAMSCVIVMHLTVCCCRRTFTTKFEFLICRFKCDQISNVHKSHKYHKTITD